jgi:hypothetical protein
MLVTKACPGCGSSVGSERFCPSCSSAIPQFHEEFSAPTETPNSSAADNGDHRAEATSPQQSAPSTVAEAPTQPCQSCGATPSAEVTLRQESGKLLWRTRRLVEGHFCRDCGISLFRDMQNRTLITGWWGIVSFFANWMTIGRNAIAARRLRGLPVPSRSPDTASALGASLDPGTPLVQRAGVWVAVAVIVVLGAVLASESSSSSGYGGSTGYTPPTGSYRAPSSYTPPTGSYRVPTTYTVPGDAGNWSYC